MNGSKDDEMKNAILEAAKRVFQKWGLNKTTMEDIAREAGKGKSTLYYYFKSKDEIFEALAMIELNIIVNNAKELIKVKTSSKQKMKNLIVSLLRDSKKTISIYPIVRGEIKGNRQVIDKILRQIDELVESLFVEVLKEGLDSGELNFLKEDQLSKAANTISCIIKGLGLYLFFDNDDDEMLDIATRLIAEGI
jgi:AcrR family transcriptional regulator